MQFSILDLQLAFLIPLRLGTVLLRLCFGDDISLQTERVLQNIVAVLGAQGIGLENVVKTTVFMTDLAKFDEMNIVYGSFFPGQPPARSTIQVAALPKGANVEIEAIAVKPS